MRVNFQGQANRLLGMTAVAAGLSKTIKSSADVGNMHAKEEVQKQVQQKQTFADLMNRLKKGEHLAYNSEEFNKLSKDEQKDVVERLMKGGAK